MSTAKIRANRIKGDDNFAISQPSAKKHKYSEMNDVDNNDESDDVSDYEDEKSDEEDDEDDRDLFQEGKSAMAPDLFKSVYQWFLQWDTPEGII